MYVRSIMVYLDGAVFQGKIDPTDTCMWNTAFFHCRLYFQIAEIPQTLNGSNIFGSLINSDLATVVVLWRLKEILLGIESV